MNKRLALFAALIVMVGGVAFAALRSDSDDPNARVLRLSQRIACPVCDGETVAESNATAAREIRADITRRVEAGESDREIMDYYRSTRAQDVLVPDDSGVGLIAWALPVFVIGGAGAALYFALRRWRGEHRLVATDADRELVAKALAEPGDDR